MAATDLVRATDAEDISRTISPTRSRIDDAEFPLEYRFEPGGEQDGVTLIVPLEAVGRLDPRRLEWLVPGLVEPKVVALIRSLPKPIRRNLVPVPETAKKVLGATPLRRRRTSWRRWRGAQPARRPADLPRRFPARQGARRTADELRVVGTEGQTLASGRDLDEVRRHLGVQAAEASPTSTTPLDTATASRHGTSTNCPNRSSWSADGLKLRAYPMLVDRQDSVSLRLADSADRAAPRTRHGLRRLFLLPPAGEIRTQVDWLPGLDRMLLQRRH